MALIKVSTDPTERELRWFARLWFPATVAAVGLFVWRATDALRWPLVVWAAGGALVLAALAARPTARVIYIGLSYVTFPIGFALSYLMLAVTYYLVLTPIGLVRRMTSRDPLHRRIERQAVSYWQARGTGREQDDYFRQS